MIEPNNIYNLDCVEGMKQIETESIDCVVTDCPYLIIAGGVRVEYMDDESSEVLNRGRKIISDGTNCSNKWVKKGNEVPSAVKNGKMFTHNNIQFHEWLPQVYRILKKGTHCYIMINSRNLKELQQECENVGFVFQNLLIWNKGNATPNKYYMQGAEFILFLSKRPAKNINEMGTTNIFNIPNVRNKTHPTEKPTKLLEQLIKNSTNVNDIVLDPFIGSGSTINACINTNRKFLGFEIDKEYYDIATNRIKEANGQTGLFAF